MRLTSTDGAQVLIEAVGYQFNDSNLGFDDATWLQIHAEVWSGDDE